MSSSREGPNPLRPYYIPPSIGISDQPPATSVPRGLPTRNGTTTTYASSARDMFSDIDYSGYVSDSSRSTLETIRELLDQALYKYVSVLMAQPFEVAKTVLQVRSQAVGDGSIPLVDTEDIQDHPSRYRDSVYDDYPSDDSDPDEVAYFTSSAPSQTSYSGTNSRRRHVTDRAGYVLPSSSSPGPHQLALKRPDSILDVIGQTWTKEGAWGVWKASNSTFVYSVLLKTVESWSTSLLAALVNVPDPGLMASLGSTIDVIDSPYPLTSLAVAVAASAMAAILLAPLDIIRTKLILTPITNKKRGLYQEARILPSWICPPALYMPTFLHSIVSPLFTHGTPLLLRSQLGIDPNLTPATFSVSTFLSSFVELFARLPLETVLRRGQMSVLNSPGHIRDGKKLDTIVDIGPYRGVVGTMWSIVKEEGESSEEGAVIGVGGVRAGKKLKKGGNRKGQGVEGLWRGWRVGFWGLVGIWGAAAMGGSSGGEF